MPILFIAYPVFGFLLMAVFISIAAMTGDAGWVPRGGTLLTAFSAVFLIYEAFFERAVRRLEGDDGHPPPSSLSFVSPIARIAQRIDGLREQARRRKSEDQRLKLVILNSFMVVVGELIQGFGDLGYMLVFGG